jgi:hypothetical protein
MSVYIILAVAFLAGGIVWFVNFIKNKYPLQSVRLFVMCVSALLSLVSVMFIYHTINILSLGGTAGALYLLSQFYYEIAPVFLKWVTQKGAVTPSEITTDGEKVLKDLQQDAANVEAQATETAVIA